MRHARVRPTSLLASAGIPLLLIAVHATNDAFSAMLAALLPTLQARFHLSEARWPVRGHAVVQLGDDAAPVRGVADRVGRRTMAAVGIVTSTVLLSLVAVAPSPWRSSCCCCWGPRLGRLPSRGDQPHARLGERFKELAVAVFSSGGTLGWRSARRDPADGADRGSAFSPLLMIPGLVLGVLLLTVAARPGVKQARRIAFLDPKLVERGGV